MKEFKIFAIWSVIILIVSCTPKVAEKVVEAPPTVVVKEVPKDDNPCTTLGELSSSKEDEVSTAYVLYKDLVKQEKYKEAFPLWQTAYYGAPAANGSIKYQYEDGIKIYKSFYDAATDPAEKQTMVDSVMAIYDKRIECFGEPAYVAGRKAFDSYYYYGEVTDEDKTYALFKEAVDGKREKVNYFVINPFTKLLSDRIVQEKISLEEGRKYAKLLLEAIDYGTSSGKNEEAWKIINAYAPQRLDNLEGIEGLYDCAYYENKYLALMRANPTDCEVINRTYSRLLWGGCDRNSDAVAEAAQAKQTNCYTPPPPDGPLKKAYQAYTDGQYKEAVRLFDEFIASTDDIAKKAKYSLLISKIYYGDIKNFPQSRKYAKQSLQHDPSSGAPHLLIGKLYASSGPLCGPGTGWDSQIVTWPAIDRWNLAKRDPAVAAEAKNLIGTYKQYMPKKEDIFLRGIKEGESIKVKCWINETTKVRTAN